MTPDPRWEALRKAAQALIDYEKTGAPAFTDWDRRFDTLRTALAALEYPAPSADAFTLTERDKWAWRVGWAAGVESVRGLVVSPSDAPSAPPEAPDRGVMVDADALVAPPFYTEKPLSIHAKCEAEVAALRAELAKSNDVGGSLVVENAALHAALATERDEHFAARVKAGHRHDEDLRVIDGERRRAERAEAALAQIGADVKAFPAMKARAESAEAALATEREAFIRDISRRATTYDAIEEGLLATVRKLEAALATERARGLEPKVCPGSGYPQVRYGGPGSECGICHQEVLAPGGLCVTHASPPPTQECDHRMCSCPEGCNCTTKGPCTAPRFRLEGAGLIDTEGHFDRCTGCGQLPPHAGCKAICAACAPPTGACYCAGCQVAGKASPPPAPAPQGEGRCEKCGRLRHQHPSHPSCRVWVASAPRAEEDE